MKKSISGGSSQMVPATLKQAKGWKPQGNTNSYVSIIKLNNCMQVRDFHSKEW